MGRPSAYSEEIAEIICDRLADGESLRAICREDEMPDRRTVLRWLESNETFAAKCARAREAQAEYLAEETIEIADTAVDADSASAAKVRVAARQWFASKVAPKKYGDRTTLAGDKDNPLNQSLTVTLKLGEHEDRISET